MDVTEHRDAAGRGDGKNTLDRLKKRYHSDYLDEVVYKSHVPTIAGSLLLALMWGTFIALAVHCYALDDSATSIRPDGAVFVSLYVFMLFVQIITTALTFRCKPCYNADHWCCKWYSLFRVVPKYRLMHKFHMSKQFKNEIGEFHAKEMHDALDGLVEAFNLNTYSDDKIKEKQYWKEYGELSDLTRAVFENLSTISRRGDIAERRTAMNILKNVGLWQGNVTVNDESIKDHLKKAIVALDTAASGLATQEKNPNRCSCPCCLFHTYRVCTARPPAFVAWFVRVTLKLVTVVTIIYYYDISDEMWIVPIAPGIDVLFSSLGFVAFRWKYEEHDAVHTADYSEEYVDWILDNKPADTKRWPQVKISNSKNLGQTWPLASIHEVYRRFKYERGSDSSGVNKVLKNGIAPVKSCARLFNGRVNLSSLRAEAVRSDSGYHRV